MKICKKGLHQFEGSQCKECQKDTHKIYHMNNKLKRNTKSKIWRGDHSGKVRYYSEYYADVHLNRLMLSTAKARAKRKNLEFNIDISDIIIPKVCPILNIPLIKNFGSGKSSNSPSLDRIDSALGYIKGNIQVISSKANTMKNNGTLDEMIMLGEWAIKEWQKRVIEII